MASNKENFYLDIMSMKQEVSGSFNLCTVRFPDESKVSFAVDCGLFQDNSKEKIDIRNEILPCKAENLSFLLVTHNHVDHIGRIPFLVKNGFRGPVYLTKPTGALIGLALRDSLKALREYSKRFERKQLYNDEDVAETLQRLKAFDYNVEFQPHPNIKVIFKSNGHLVGAASIMVVISYPGEEDINILFSGDYNNKNVFFNVPPMTSDVFKAPVSVIMESTYGDMNSREIHKIFRRNVTSWIKEKGRVIIPVFSLGRAQEILYELKLLQYKKKIPLDIPIFYDGKLSQAYSRLYKNNILGIDKEMENFMPMNVTMVDKDVRARILEMKGSFIIVTTSGMGTYGPAQTYIPHFLSDEKALIHFTGYCAEGTLGAKLKEAKHGELLKVSGIMIEKKAKVEFTAEFSAHAKADELIDFLKQFENLKMVMVNHGDQDTKAVFAKRVMHEVQPKQVGILGECYAFRIGAYGFIKSYPSRC